MAIELVTGYAGAPHVTSAQDGRINAAAWGSGKYVLQTQSQFAITVNSATSVTVSTGDAMMEGRHVAAESPTTLTVGNGTQNMSRIDTVCIVYSKASGGVESATLEVVQGTETTGTPVAPTLPSGSVLEGDSACYMPLWDLPITGIALGEPVQRFTVSPGLYGNDNATYALSYANAQRTITLSGENGGQTSVATIPTASSTVPGLVTIGSGITATSGRISVQTATASRDGLMTSTQAAALSGLTGGVGNVSGGMMGFGYQNASKTWYLYFPVNAVGKTSAQMVGNGVIDISGNGETMTISGAVLATMSLNLRNGGALLEVSLTTSSAFAGGTRQVVTAWTTGLNVIFS